MEGTMSEIRLFAGNFAPRYWASCDGQLLAISTNSALFSLLGTTFGGNGVQNFALPDLRGRVAVGTGVSLSGINTALGQIGGEVNHTITQGETPTHNHAPTNPTTPPSPVQVSNTNATATVISPGVSLGTMGTAEGRSGFAAISAYNSTAPDTTLNAASVALSITEGTTGGGQPHNNMQPYCGIMHVICLQGVFPSRN